MSNCQCSISNNGFSNNGSSSNGFSSNSFNNNGFSNNGFSNNGSNNNGGNNQRAAVERALEDCRKINESCRAILNQFDGISENASCHSARNIREDLNEIRRNSDSIERIVCMIRFNENCRRRETIEEGLRDIREGMGDVEEGLNNVCRGNVCEGVRDIREGVHDIQEGVRDIEVALSGIEFNECRENCLDINIRINKCC